MTNKHLIALIFIFLPAGLLLSGCSKEDVQKDIILKAMTSGRWIVSTFTETGSDFSADFTPWEFQFFENETVQAIKGTTTITGSWTANVDARTITASFPAGDATVARLNDTWLIYNNTFTLVEANPLNTSRNAYLKLNKK
ncbi:MAG: hypothetical protein EAZ17_03600 [Sphingobacteriales bacterium]|nr:MAG: hypothetical protein EAZ17_03600 [Sphingobacteriales bacterium]